MTDDGPRRVSDREVPLAITGHFMPTQAPNAPVLVGMPGTDDLFVFVFSTEGKLPRRWQRSGSSTRACHASPAGGT